MKRFLRFLTLGLALILAITIAPIGKTQVSNSAMADSYAQYAKDTKEYFDKIQTVAVKDISLSRKDAQFSHYLNQKAAERNRYLMRQNPRPGAEDVCRYPNVFCGFNVNQPYRGEDIAYLTYVYKFSIAQLGIQDGFDVNNGLAGNGQGFLGNKGPGGLLPLGLSNYFDSYGVSVSGGPENFQIYITIAMSRAEWLAKMGKDVSKATYRTVKSNDDIQWGRRLPNGTIGAYWLSHISGEEWQKRVRALSSEVSSVGRKSKHRLVPKTNRISSGVSRLKFESVFSDVVDPKTERPKSGFVGEINHLYLWGYTTGWNGPKGQRLYRPDQKITREAMAAFLYRYAHGGERNTAQFNGKEFKDVGKSNPFRNEIMWLRQTGITTGWNDGTFRPKEPISREAMTAFLYRLCSQKTSKSFGYGPFPQGDFDVRLPLPTAVQKRMKESNLWLSKGAGGSICDPLNRPNRYLVPKDGQRLFKDTVVNRTTGFGKEIWWAKQIGITTGWGDGSFHPEAPISREAMAAFIYRLHTDKFVQ
ncbi:hypothetical protein BK816_06265 [Boudabousia tangfeifanii]|uniref:SLH domain-containing protein n=1 Tax=Boudabousia tangfeifanii TaxID=1912795 RepID=A0A1D9ML93_9ACTO|nr:S-layer homology domain-containing protein [Boudabousia tangfeifanii]AOZ72943.1 hypothetical protein BK816_06265 [Boudabousia tangfeifanii]